MSKRTPERIPQLPSYRITAGGNEGRAGMVIQADVTSMGGLRLTIETNNGHWPTKEDWKAALADAARQIALIPDKH